MSISKQKANTRAQIAQNPGRIFAPLNLPKDYPIRWVLTGRRDDRRITQLHIHDGLEVGYCVEGSGTFFVGSKILPFRQHDFTVITPLEFHRCRANSGTTSRWIWFFLQPSRFQTLMPGCSVRYRPEKLSGLRFPNVFSAEKFSNLSALVRLMIEEAQSEPEISRVNIIALFTVFLNRIDRLFGSNQNSQASINLQERTDTAQRLAPALALIEGDIRTPHSIPDLAAACGMGVRNFQQSFSSLMGLSPHRYLQRVRIQAGTAMLEDRSQSILEVAHDCGFNSLSSFNRAFRAENGTSPRNYRKLATDNELRASQ